MTKYENGVPSWVDMGSHDLPAAVRFYGGLFGWEMQDTGEQAGHYTIASKNGKQVAALATAQDPGPPRWTMYVHADDADAASEAATRAGGKVIFGPTDVMSAGRMAVLVDTTGAVVSVWQPRDHLGAQLVNEPGAFAWGELSTSDMAKSKAFYSDVFGWGWGGQVDTYAEAQVKGNTVAGITPRSDSMPADAPDFWLTYFGSDDVDRDTERVRELGGDVVVTPMDIPGTGRFSVVRDGEGAIFGLFA